jgi:toxin ParE1/3/4
MANFNLTPRAKEDLRAIWHYTRDTWGEAQADRYVSTLYERFGWLAENPASGKPRADIHEGYHSFPQGKHLVFYLRFDGYIDIIGVPHQSMDVVDYFDEEE